MIKDNHIYCDICENEFTEDDYEENIHINHVFSDQSKYHDKQLDIHICMLCSERLVELMSLLSKKQLLVNVETTKRRK